MHKCATIPVDGDGLVGLGLREERQLVTLDQSTVWGSDRRFGTLQWKPLLTHLSFPRCACLAPPMRAKPCPVRRWSQLTPAISTLIRPRTSLAPPRVVALGRKAETDYPVRAKG
jgi:hypothetical protein